ncbi:hypothetical protein OIDMADRAFT_19745 [Oidiodendron maius Zn]|uniref:Uncharacterized protein n=1 Tax=Oidiodendron maius (strain Zn) TaxID=913774 RepID=A0A0C3CL29_OIDMZ|nr:hypothetical protein OIDMADRAFT_19745 [Oidiodendron maius Zn]
MSLPLSAVIPPVFAARFSTYPFAFVTGSETNDHRHHLHAMCLTFEYTLLLKPLNRDR